MMRDVFNKLGFVILELHPRVLQIANGDFAIICHLANHIFCSVLNLEEIHSKCLFGKMILGGRQSMITFRTDIRCCVVGPISNKHL